MHDPVTISKMFDHWHFEMGNKCVPISVETLFGMKCLPMAWLNYILARRGEHQVLIVFDRWEQLVADSLIEMLVECDLPA